MGENLWERAKAALEHINDVCDPNEVDINLPPLLAEMERVEVDTVYTVNGRVVDVLEYDYANPRPALLLLLPEDEMKERGVDR